MTDHDGTEDEGRILPQEEPEETPTEAIDRLAGELEGVGRRAAGGATEFTRGSNVFAVQAGPKMEFRLRAEVAAAGLRTPATSRSTRGPDWIALDTKAGDVFTVDRVVAWFEMAWRIAGGPGGGAPGSGPKPH